MVHDADHRHAVVLPADGEGQAAGDGVHLVVAQLHSGLPCRGVGGTAETPGREGRKTKDDARLKRMKVRAKLRGHKHSLVGTRAKSTALAKTFRKIVCPLTYLVQFLIVSPHDMERGL